MDYIYFDIECANCNDGNGKICSFGYCLTDENFFIKEKRDIVINPNAPFCLNGGYSNKKYINLAYPEATFLRAPKFNALYDTLRGLLTAPDRVVIGHAVSNDVGFLVSECMRYGKEIFEYDYYDMQEIYRRETNQNSAKALGAICSEVNIPSLCAHRSDDDAEMTMEVAKYLCGKTELTMNGLLAKYADCKSSVNDLLLRKEQKRQCAVFQDFVKNLVRTEKKDDSLKGKQFCFSHKIEKAGYPLLASYVQEIANHGGFYAPRLRFADYFVRDKESCERLDKAKANRRIKIIDIEGLASLVGKEKDDFCPIDEESYIEEHKNEPKHVFVFEYRENKVNTIADLVNYSGKMRKN